MTIRSSLVVAAVFGMALPTLALAQNADGGPSSSGVAQQFKDGANGVGQGFTNGASTVGHGAVSIGRGIKNGAILTWDAVKEGTQTAVSRISGN